MEELINQITDIIDINSPEKLNYLLQVVLEYHIKEMSNLIKEINELHLPSCNNCMFEFCLDKGILCKSWKENKNIKVNKEKSIKDILISIQTNIIKQQNILKALNK